jgi:hypothetical protein
VDEPESRLLSVLTVCERDLNALEDLLERLADDRLSEIIHHVRLVRRMQLLRTSRFGYPAPDGSLAHASVTSAMQPRRVVSVVPPGYDQPAPHRL